MTYNRKLYFQIANFCCFYVYFYVIIPNCFLLSFTCVRTGCLYFIRGCNNKDAKLHKCLLTDFLNIRPKSETYFADGKDKKKPFNASSFCVIRITICSLRASSEIKNHCHCHQRHFCSCCAFSHERLDHIFQFLLLSCKKTSDIKKVLSKQKQPCMIQSIWVALQFA